MTYWESLLALLLVIYLSECFLWLPKDRVAFTSSFYRRWRLKQPIAFLEFRHGGLLFRNPVPPLGISCVCQHFPISLSPSGVCLSSLTFTPDQSYEQQQKYFDYADIRSVEVSSNHVLINGERFLKCQSLRLAKFVEDLICRLSEASMGKREVMIESALAQLTDTDKISEQREFYHNQSTKLRFFCNVLFVYIFGIVPLIMWRYSLRSSWIWVLLELVILMCGVTVLYYLAHKSLHPQDRYERRLHLAIMVLSPPAAIRANDVVARNSFDLFHPLAVAQVLCPEEAFVQSAQQLMLDMRFPVDSVRPTLDLEDAHSTEQWFRTKFLHSVERLVQRAGTNPDDLIKPPLPDDTNSLSYCPRCHCQYTKTEGVCFDCGGMTLQPFSENDRQTDAESLST